MITTGTNQIVQRSIGGKTRAKAALAGSNFGENDLFAGILDAFHGETHFGLDAPVTEALKAEWIKVLAGEAEMFYDGKLYEKVNPTVLRVLAAEHLFDKILIDGDKVPIENIVVCPYSSTLLFEEVCQIFAKPGGIVLSPEGFYKNYASHVAKFSCTLAPVLAGADQAFKVMPEHIHAAIQNYGSKSICFFLMTIPGNPIYAPYSQDELTDICRLLWQHRIPIVCDSVFDRFIPNYTPLAATEFHQNGTLVRMHEHTITLHGNSKGYGASGPLKMGAACTGNVEWLDQLTRRQTILFQRESIHLVRQVFERTRPKYFAENVSTMQVAQAYANQAVRNLQKSFPHYDFGSVPKQQRGIFLNLAFSQDFMQKAGLHSSLELEDFLLLATGVDSVCFLRMGGSQNAVRLNILCPRKNGKKSPDHVPELFDRLHYFCGLVEGGLQYRDLLATHRIDAV